MAYHPNKAALIGAIVSLLMIWAAAASAQEQDNPGLGTDIAPEPDQDHIILGVGGGIVPAYQGAKSYRVLPFPAMDVKEGMFFANLRNGLGIAPIDSDFVTVGAGLNYVMGYRRQDVPHGIDKLSDAMGARIFAAFHTYGLETTFGVTDIVTGGTGGLLADASLSYPLEMSSRLSLIPAVAATWADGKHNDRYFGVTGAASGLPKFTAGPGFNSVSGTLTAVYRLTDSIILSVTGSVMTLAGDVQDSPLIFHKTQPAGFFAISYRL